MSFRDVKVASCAGALIAVLSIAVSALTALGISYECAECCFDDVVVSGAGVRWANARFDFSGGINCGRPDFGFTLAAFGCYRRAGSLLYVKGVGWRLSVWLLDGETSILCGVPDAGLKLVRLMCQHRSKWADQTSSRSESAAGNPSDDHQLSVDTSNVPMPRSGAKSRT